MAEKKGLTLSAKLFLLLIVAIVLAYALSTNEPVSTDTPSDEELKKFAYHHSQDYVRGMLKAPATAQFPYYDDSFIKEIKSEKKGKQHQSRQYQIKSYVDSQNSFGALIRTNYTCSLIQIHDDKKQESRYILLSLKFN
jgi:hypothetical protein